MENPPFENACLDTVIIPDAVCKNKEEVGIDREVFFAIIKHKESDEL